MIKYTALAAVLVLAGCETLENNRELAGAGIGAALGGVACAISSANDTECALLVAGGAAAGYAIGRYMDRQDQDAYRLATYDVLNKGQSSSTHVSSLTVNSITATKSASITPPSNASLKGCQEVRYNYTTDFKETYCRDADGYWVKV